MPEPNTPEYWRAEAERCRKSAGLTLTMVSARRWMERARECDCLAARLEADEAKAKEQAG